MNPVLKNIVRTAVPSVVGAVASVIAKAKANLTPSETAVLFPIVTTAYYSLTVSYTHLTLSTNREV